MFKCSTYVGKPQQSSYEETVLDLYKVVSQTDLITCKESVYSNIQSLSVRDISSLFVIHKYAFNDIEWMRVVYFEFHFNTAFPKSTNLDLHYQIKQKNEFWKDCQKVHSLVPIIIKQQKSLLRDRKLRKDQAEVLNGVCLKGYCKHLPCINDDDVTNILRGYPPHSKDFALVINCNGTCKHHQGLHLLVCLCQDCPENDLREISPAIVNEVENNHSDTLLDIIFIKERGIQSYVNEAGDVQRFKLFDNTTQGRLSRDIVFHYKIKTTAESWQGSHDNCTRCYNSYSLMSLDWRSLDIEREGLLDVPLLIQIIFETFLNHESLTRTQNFNTSKGRKKKKSIPCLNPKAIQALSNS